jgi:LAO/AO transport system kinase
MSAVLAERLIAGERAALARAITLVESKRADHETGAQALLQAALPHTGRAVRLGITGVPGAGKSTLVDQLGVNLTARGHRVAVLAVDPTSQRTGGSILGDKTRMARLSIDPNAFIRPSPAGATLGGVARRTRETMLLCEAAGFDVVIVETVGIGQSETAVAAMVDFFLVLMVPGTGDDLQGIKKGVLEIADMIAVNKADGDNEARARHAAADYRAALSILAPADPEWQPPVILVSGLRNLGLDHLWAEVMRHRELMSTAGKLDARRQEQQVAWMWSLLEERLKARLTHDPRVRGRLQAIEDDVRHARLTPVTAVNAILGAVGF